MNIETPFIFGRAAEGTYFTDREEDAKRLVKGAVLIYPMLDIAPAVQKTSTRTK